MSTEKPKIELLNMDCMEYMAGLPDNVFDLAIVDPPYGMLQYKWDKAPQMDILIRSLKRVVKDNGTMIFFSQQPFTSTVVTALGKSFSHEIIWHKTQKGGFPNANRMPLRAHENIIVAKVKTGVFYNPIKVKRGGGGRVRTQTSDRNSGYGKINLGGNYVDTGLKFPESVIKISNWNGAIFGDTKNSVKHPTQKPVELYSWILKHYARPHCNIVDPFLGSASSAISANQMGFDFVGCELDKDYYDAACKRFKEQTKQLSLL